MIQEKEYKQRRDRLAVKLESNSIAIIHSNSYQVRSNDTEFPFRQNSNFYYLTGFKEDNACLVFIKKKRKVKTILFLEKKDVAKELWTGKRLGEEEAKKLFELDTVYTMDEFSAKYKEMSLAKEVLYYDFKQEESKLKYLLNNSRNISTHKNIAIDIGMLRLIKSKSEVKLIQKALKITKEAHHTAIRYQKEAKNEYQLLAKIEYIFKKNGAYSDAYTSIVAGGNSANTLHYIENNRKFLSGELILIDAGCEYQYYASDITRTIPVNGKFTQAQKELYNMVLEVQLEVISMIGPDVMRTALQTKSEELLCKGMIELGILKGDYKKLLKKKAYKKYYPHGIGHWMGIDVHDENPYKYINGDEIPLTQGMVLTIEPGIYCDKDDESIPKKYRGIGIRIEDDILVTKDGYKNLSAKIAKSVQEIESL